MAVSLTSSTKLNTVRSLMSSILQTALLLFVLLMVVVEHVQAQKKHSIIQDFVKKATNKIDKTVAKQKISEKQKAPPKVEYRRKTYAEQKQEAFARRNRPKKSKK